MNAMSRLSIQGPDARLLSLCNELHRKIAAHGAAAALGDKALARAGQAVVLAAGKVATEKPATPEGIQAKARVAYILACDGGPEPDSNGLVHTVMIALMRDLI